MPHSILKSIPLNPESVLFWTGAGVSMDPPSSLPSGYRLTKDIVDAFCLPGTWASLTSLLRQTRFNDSTGNKKTIPRLEALLGNIVSMLGSSFLCRFSSLNPTPNALHYFFAQHIEKQGKHITLNLDLGIENAINHLFGSFAPLQILHLHGKFSDSPLDLGLTFENLAKGLSNYLSQNTLKAILDANTIIFAGYSGSDFFDINPFFLNLVGKEDLSGKLVIWLDHNSNNKGVTPYHRSNMRSKIMDVLHNCNANTYVWKGPTKHFIDNLRTIVRTVFGKG